VKKGEWMFQLKLLILPSCLPSLHHWNVRKLSENRNDPSLNIILYVVIF